MKKKREPRSLSKKDVFLDKNNQIRGWFIPDQSFAFGKVLLTLALLFQLKSFKGLDAPTSWPVVMNVQAAYRTALWRKQVKFDVIFFFFFTH